MAKNIYSLQLLRNGTPYSNRNDAYAALQSASGLTNTNNKDGVPVLARYYATENNATVVKTLLGIYAYGVSGGNDYMTIIDVEGSSADVEELRSEINAKLGTGVTSANTATEQLAALSGNTASTSADTSVEGAKKYADEKISQAINALDYDLAKDDNKVVVSLNQTDGKISGTSENITGVKLAGLTAGTDTKIAATDTLGQALANLQGQIDAMDLGAVGSNDGVITVVSEADGKVAATSTPITSISLSGFTADTSATAVTPISSGDTVNLALNKLQNSIAAAQSATTVYSSAGTINVVTGTTGTEIDVKIKTGEKVLAIDSSSGGVYTDLDLVKITTGLPETIKERYQLLATDDTQIGVNIDVPKDSHIVSITYITDSGDTHYQNLEYKYIDASGATQTTYVNMSNLVLETEFASGVTATDGIVHGVVDSESEKDSQETPVDFLTVGANGFKVSGIKDEIDRKINALDATVGGQTVETGKHVAVEVVEANGILTAVTVTETNIADADDLAELSAKTVTNITSTNNSISATSAATTDGTVEFDLITDASKILMSGYTAETGGFIGISEASSVTQAFKEVELQILANERVVAAALNDLDTRIKEIASGTTEALDDEIAARKAVDGVNGDAYTADTTAHYISGASNLYGADQALDAALKVVDDAMVTAATMNGSAVTKTDKVLAFTAVASSAHTESNNAIIIDTANGGGLTFSLGTLDAGTY